MEGGRLGGCRGREGYDDCPEVVEAGKDMMIVLRFWLHESFLCAGGQAGQDACTVDIGSLQYYMQSVVCSNTCSV